MASTVFVCVVNVHRAQSPKSVVRIEGQVCPDLELFEERQRLLLRSSHHFRLPTDTFDCRPCRGSNKIPQV